MKKFNTIQKTIPLIEIEKNKWNPNQQNDLIFNKLKKSITEYGFTNPILVRQVNDKYEIIDGEHRYKACIALGYEFIKVEDIGEIEDNMAKTLTIALNNIRGEDDIIKRAQILKQLNDGQLALMPWNEQEIKNELELANFDWSQFDKEEQVEEKKEHTLCFSFNNKENAVIRFALKQTGKENNEALFAIVKEYLDLRVDTSKYKDVFGI